MTNETTAWVFTSIAISIISTSAAWWKIYQERSKYAAMDLNDLRSTKVFDRIASLINEYSTFIAGCKLRQELFRDIMITKLEVFKAEVNQLINKEDVGQLTDSEFLARWRNFMSDMTTAGYKACLEISIPEFILVKLQTKTDSFMAVTNAAINRVCEDDITYTNKYAKTCALVWEITDRVSSEIPIITRTLDDFNGDISSIEYKGFTKEHCSDSKCSCKKGNLTTAIRAHAELLRNNRKCLGKNVGCVWKQHPSNLNLISDLDLVNATFICSQCVLAEEITEGGCLSDTQALNKVIIPSK